MTEMIVSYLAEPVFSRLWQAARSGWERNGGLAGSAVLQSVSEDEAIALSGLLSRRRPYRPATTVRVSLAELDRALRDAGGSLASWLERTGGPLVNRPAERARVEEEKTELWAGLHERAAGTDLRLAAVVDDLRALGLARRLAGGQEAALLHSAMDVLSRVLELDHLVDIAVLAAECCGDAKALNDRSPVGTLVLRGLAVIDGISSPTCENERRSLWLAHRVLCDPLSSRVMVLNMTAAGGGFLARSLRLSAEAGEPRVVTLRELTRTIGIVWPGEVFVCENPTVLSAAAEHFGAGSRPVVCVEGWGSVAAQHLLDQMLSQGAHVRYHGDFDWSGLRIAERAIGKGAKPWRFGASDYREALAHGGPTRALAGTPHEASWDSALAPTMRHHAQVIEEEGAPLAALLSDLAG